MKTLLNLFFLTANILVVMAQDIDYARQIVRTLASKKTGTICSLIIQGILSFLSSVYLIYLNMKNKPVTGSTSENAACVYFNNANMKHNHYNTPERPFHTAGTFLNALFRIVDCLSEHFKAGVKVPQGDSGSFRVALCIKGAENQLWKGNAEQTAFHVLLP